MKLSLMRPALVLALALGLASCGGKALFTIGGSISGLKHGGLELSSNGMKIAVDAPPATATGPTEFKFPNQIEYGELYKVEITKQPDHESCVIVPPTGTNTAGRLTTINVLINCFPIANTISGKVDGLTLKGLVLANGSTGGTVSPTPDAPTFKFPAVEYGKTYGITVQAQPNDPTTQASQTCTVSPNGVGVMGDTEVKDVVVTCK